MKIKEDFGKPTHSLGEVVTILFKDFKEINLRKIIREHQNGFSVTLLRREGRPYKTIEHKEYFIPNKKEV